MLEITGLTVGYGTSSVVHDISFSVGRGQMVALVGPNGAGKTTTLKAVMGLVRPTNGEIRFDGTLLNGRKTAWVAEQGIALVPEGRGVFGTLTVAENLTLGLTPLKKGATASRADTFEAVLQRFPVLRRYLHRSAALLSGGEQQQLVIARALIGSPTLLILDEPSLGLAPKMTETVFEILDELRKEGTTILLVEQNATQAVRLADYSYVLVSGALVAEGKATDLLGDASLAARYFGLD